LSEPIIITKNGRERLVLLSVDEYNMLLHLRELYDDSKEPSAKRSQSATDAPRKEPARKVAVAGTRRKVPRR
jgi:prevent-host-death family protein